METVLRGKAFIERGLSHRLLFWIEAFSITIVAVALAVWLKPEPFSDWEYYWRTAHDFARYERGGVTLLFLSALVRVGMPAYLTVLVPNIAAGFLVLFLSRTVDPTKGKWLAHLTAVFLLLLTPYCGIFQLDMLATAELAFGLVLLILPEERERKSRSILGFLLLAAAVSTRPQFMLVLLSLSILLVFTWKWSRSRPRSLMVPTLALVLASGAITGFSLDSGIRALANHAGALRTNSAVTLYSGLLVSDASGPGCGQWSEHATAEMRSDLALPLPEAIWMRLQSKPFSHWLAVVECKIPQITMPPAFAGWWLFETPSVRDKIRLSPQGAGLAGPIRAVRWIETRAYRAVTLVLYSVLVYVVIRYRSSMLALLPILWIGAFISVHLVFEVQGRYFLSMLLMIPLLCSLVMITSRSRDTGSSPGAVAGA